MTRPHRPAAADEERHGGLLIDPVKKEFLRTAFDCRVKLARLVLFVRMRCLRTIKYC